MTITNVGSQAGGATKDAISAGAPAARAFPGNVTAGNLVWFQAAKNDSADFVAGDLTKSAGTATLGAIQLDKNLRSGDMTIGIWSAIVTGTGSCTLKAGAADGTYTSIASNELNATTGWDASRLETTNTGSGNAAAQTTANMTSAGEAAFVGAVITDQGANFLSWTQDSPYTQIFVETNGNIHQPGLYMQQLVSGGTTDAISSTSTSEGAMLYIAAGVVYKPVAAATQASDRGGIAASSISEINGIAKASVAAINGLTI